MLRAFWLIGKRWVGRGNARVLIWRGVMIIGQWCNWAREWHCIAAGMLLVGWLAGLIAIIRSHFHKRNANRWCFLLYCILTTKKWTKHVLYPSFIRFIFIIIYYHLLSLLSFIIIYPFIIISVLIHILFNLIYLSIFYNYYFNLNQL